MTENATDIVVGICSRNCADTVGAVLKAVDCGLTQFFPFKRILIVVSDGFSTDATQEKVQETETTTEVASLGTDGRDGPTDAAGGMVDGGTVGRMREEGIDPEESLAQNDAYHALSQLGELVITGPTGTNVADLCFIPAGKQE